MALPTICWAAGSSIDTLAYYAFPNAWLASNQGNATGLYCDVEYYGVGNNEKNGYVDANGDYFLKFTGDASYVIVKPTGERFRSGDTVTLYINNSSVREDAGCYLHSSSGNKVTAAMTQAGKAVNAKYVLTGDDMEGDGSLKFVRISSNCRVHSFMVTRDPNAPVAQEYYIRYIDQNGNKLGEDTVSKDNAVLKFRYTEQDLPSFPDSQNFRGWFTSVGRKAVAGSAVTEDMTLYARVTDIEYASEGKRYTYNLADDFFYAEDHECIDKGETAYTLQLTPTAYVKVDGKLTLYKDQRSVQIPLTAKQLTVYYVHRAVEKNDLGYYVINSDDSNTLLVVLQLLKDGDRVLLLNGTYDLGNDCLTEVNKNNISIVGESMEGTVICNTALVPGISKTGTILLTGTNTYLQDLTLQNHFDYYAKNEGQAIALHDKGTKTICKNVRLLSYQDTYYSNKIGAWHYFEDCEIHGTVDFICGDGSTYFYRTLLYGEKRTLNGGGSIALTASNADPSDKGYVFDACTIQSVCPMVSLGRSWNNSPKCYFLNSTIDFSKGEFSLNNSEIQRWTIGGMNVLPEAFGEYNTRDTQGQVVSPASNEVTFILNGKTKKMETILTADSAANLMYDKFFSNGWNPAAETKIPEVKAELNGTTLTLSGDGAQIYLIYNNGAPANMLPAGTYTDVQLEEGRVIEVRGANARGGFGPKVPLTIVTALDRVSEAAGVCNKQMINGRIVIFRNGQSYTITGQNL